MYKTTFAELKTRAKDVLKSNYWYSFGVCILVSLITSLGTSVATVTNMVNSDAGSAGTSISAVLQILITLFVKTLKKSDFLPIYNKGTQIEHLI